MDEWEELYGHSNNKLPNANHICKTLEKHSKTISSKATDINDIPIKQMIELTKNFTRDEMNMLLKNFKWIKFNSRVICLRKDGKEPNKVTNLRPIQISPFTFKLAEQSRKRLKDWLNNATSEKCYAFKPKSSVIDLVSWLKSKIVNYENG